MDDFYKKAILKTLVFTGLYLAKCIWTLQNALGLCFFENGPCRKSFGPCKMLLDHAFLKMDHAENHLDLANREMDPVSKQMDYVAIKTICLRKYLEDSNKILDLYPTFLNNFGKEKHGFSDYLYRLIDRLEAKIRYKYLIIMKNKKFKFEIIPDFI